MKWFGRTQSYVSLVVHTSVQAFVLNKKNERFSVIATEILHNEYSGIVDGRLINPSFFIDTLYGFFKKNNIQNPLTALLITHEDYASALQYTIYFEYFRIPLTHVVTKILDKTQEQSALDLWQGE